MKINQNIIIITILLILMGLGGFFAGTKYQQSKTPTFFAGMRNGRNGNVAFSETGGNRMGFRPVSGEIVMSDNTSITVKMSDGSSKIILLSAFSLLFVDK